MKAMRPSEVDDYALAVKVIAVSLLLQPMCSDIRLRKSTCSYLFFFRVCVSGTCILGSRGSIPVQAQLRFQALSNRT